MSKLTWLVQKLMAEYGIEASGVIWHYDVTGKRCPAPHVDAGKWAALRATITGGASGVAAGGGSGAGAPSGSAADLAARVIAGEFGNVDARRTALGTHYDEVQTEVNRILLGGGCGSGSQDSSFGESGADIESLVQAMIRDEYGNGEARRAAPGANCDAAQARVNENPSLAGRLGGIAAQPFNSVSRCRAFQVRTATRSCANMLAELNPSRLLAHSFNDCFVSVPSLAP